MKNGYGGKRQKQSTQLQGACVIQPDRADLWQGYSGQRVPVQRQMPAPLAAGGRDDIRMMGQPRPLRAEERIYVEPPGAPEIGRRPLDLEAGRPTVPITHKFLEKRVCIFTGRAYTASTIFHGRARIVE